VELTYDWQSFQTMFYPKRRSATRLQGETAGPVYLVVEGNIIVAAFAECEDLSDWLGAEYEEMAAEMPHRELLLFDRAKVDQWLSEAVALPHVHEQMDFLRTKASESVVSTRARPSKKGRKTSKGNIELKQEHGHLGRQHFLLEAMQGWWGKVLPSAYGPFLRLEGQHEKDLFVLVRRGRIEAFHEPDLSSMGRDRRKVPADVVKYLSEKHLVPVQGMFVPAQAWAEWSDSPTPWRLVAAAVKANQAKMVPFRWSLVSMMASRAFLGL
jgi:hypothetical protein